MIRLRSLDLSFRTAYAQAKETALAQREVPLLTAGTVQFETRAGGKFAYRYRYDATGKRITEYLGAESDEQTRIKVEQARLEIREHEILAGPWGNFSRFDNSQNIKMRRDISVRLGAIDR